VSEAFDRISTNMEMFDQGTRGATVAAYERDAMAEEV
jgi:ABC-type sulfate transport system substrate-binding protein